MAFFVQNSWIFLQNSARILHAHRNKDPLINAYLSDYHLTMGSCLPKAGILYVEVWDTYGKLIDNNTQW